MKKKLLLALSICHIRRQLKHFREFRDFSIIYFGILNRSLFVPVRILKEIILKEHLFRVAMRYFFYFCLTFSIAIFYVTNYKSKIFFSIHYPNLMPDHLIKSSKKKKLLWGNLMMPPKKKKKIVSASKRF